MLRTPTALRGERHIASKWPRLASLARVFLFVPLTSKLDGLQTKSPAYFRRRGHLKLCGGGGIRTLGTLAGTTVFETAPFDRSGTPPSLGVCNPNNGTTSGDK